jgi:hypothetical protein
MNRTGKDNKENAQEGECLSNHGDRSNLALKQQAFQTLLIGLSWKANLIKLKV